MITGKTEIIYDWFEIQQAICDLMGIPEDKFSSYHKIVGGDYKNLWHVALHSVIPERMRNDVVVTMYPIEDPEMIPYYVKENGDWSEPFFHAYNRVMDEIDPDCRGVYVEFSW